MHILSPENQSCHSCTWQVVWSCSTFLPSIIKIFKRVFNLQSRHEMNGLSLSNITKRENTKSKRQSCHSCTRHVVWSCSTLLPSTIEIFQRVFELQSEHEIFFKSKQARVVNLVCDTSSRPDLYFHQVSSKYSKGYSSYRAGKKFYADADADTDTDADANGIHPKNNMSHLPPFGMEGGHN